MSGKSKGRSFEREIYKKLRDSKLFKKVNLTLGSGNTDETSDINVTTINGDLLVFELKTGDRTYLTEKNLNKWWDKLIKECLETEQPFLTYREDYKPIMIMFYLKFVPSGNKLRIRTEFEQWLNNLKK